MTVFIFLVDKNAFYAVIYNIDKFSLFKLIEKMIHLQW
ncbi:hypothetical protein SPWS13_4211 [Shewanella putrefaciens]|nr:hypothetical protein SPWS13_4211 [Shewanella putrefaciens]